MRRSPILFLTLIAFILSLYVMRMLVRIYQFVSRVYRIADFQSSIKFNIQSKNAYLSASTSL